MVMRKFLLLILFIFLTTPSLADSNGFVEAEIASKYLYTNSEIILKVRIYHTSKIVFGEMPPLEITGPSKPTIKKLKTKAKQTEFKYGENYNYSEQNFAIFVDTAGKYQIKSFEFKATSNYEVEKLVSESIRFDVKNAPKLQNNEWRSAYSLDIKSGIDQKQAKVGDTINRVILLTARGADKKLFDKLNIPAVNGARVYESPVIETEIIGEDNLILEQRYNYVYIPQKEGQLFFPDINFEWFDLSKNEIKQSKISGASFDIEINSASEVAGVDGEKLSFAFNILHFYMAVLILFLLALLIYLSLKMKTYIYKLNQKNKKLLLLKRVCYKNDPNSSLKLVISIAIDNGIKDIKNISELSKILNDVKFSKQVILLNEKIFNNKNGWKGKEFYTSFIYAIKKYKKKSENNEFPSLYPIN